VGFSQTHAAKEYNVGFFFDKLQPEDVLNLKAVDFFGPGPINPTLTPFL
jgi:hypothetical protein